MIPSQHPDILLMDGDCELCNRTQRFIEPRLLVESGLNIIPQQSRRGQEILSGLSNKIQNADSMVLVRNGKPYIRSAAGWRCLLYMKWNWRWLSVFIWLVPLPIRDLAYNILARNRNRMFKTTNIKI